VTAPVPEPPDVLCVNVLPNATVLEFVNVNVACAL